MLPKVILSAYFFTKNIDRAYLGHPSAWGICIIGTLVPIGTMHRDLSIDIERECCLVS